MIIREATLDDYKQHIRKELSKYKGKKWAIKFLKKMIARNQDYPEYVSWLESKLAEYPVSGFLRLRAIP